MPTNLGGILKILAALLAGITGVFLCAWLNSLYHFLQEKSEARGASFPLQRSQAFDLIREAAVLCALIGLSVYVTTWAWSFVPTWVALLAALTLWTLALGLTFYSDMLKVRNEAKDRAQRLGHLRLIKGDHKDDGSGGYTLPRANGNHH